MTEIVIDLRETLHKERMKERGQVVGPIDLRVVFPRHEPCHEERSREMNEMMQPHYVKIYINNWIIYSDGRRVGNEPLPRKFKDWFEANDYAVNCRHCAQIFPYYPEWAELERRYIDGLVAKQEAAFALVTAKHEEALGALIAERDAIPSGVVGNKSVAVSL